MTDMTRQQDESGIHVARGASRMLLEGVEQLTPVVEGMHANIAARPPPLGTPTDAGTYGITGLVYESVRQVNGAVRGVLDLALRWLPEDSLPALPQPHWDAVQSALNGVLGDYLTRTANPLAITMELRRHGRALPLQRRELAAALPQATRSCSSPCTACVSATAIGRGATTITLKRWPRNMRSRPCTCATTPGITYPRTAARSQRCWRRSWRSGRCA